MKIRSLLFALLWPAILFAQGGTPAGAYGPPAAPVRSISFQLGVPAGSALSTGTIAYYTVPFACKITGWSIQLDAGTATIKVWKIAAGTANPTVSNSINTSGVAISTGTVVQSVTLSDFTATQINTNDIVAANITATSGAGYINFQLVCQ